MFCFNISYVILDGDKAIEYVLHNVSIWDLLYLKFKHGIMQTLISNVYLRVSQIN